MRKTIIQSVQGTQHRRNYSKGDDAKRMQNALAEALANPEPNMLAVASKHDISRKSLTERITGNIAENAQVGRRPLLTQEEEANLVNFLVEMSALGFGYNLEQLKGLVRKLFNKNADEFTNGWLSYFFKKHPEITKRRTEALDRLRNNALNEEHLNFYFSILESAFKKCEQLSGGNSLTRNRIFAMDETGFQPNKKLGYVIASRGSKNVFALCSECRDHLTIVAFASALGINGRPMFITPRKIPNFLGEYFPGALVASSSSGYINDNLFADWCQFFVKEIQEIRGDPSNWCLLVLDGLQNHTLNPVGLRTLNHAKILAVSLPSHSSSVLQVHDVSIFGPLKKYFYKSISEYIRTKGPNVTLRQLPEILEKPWELANSVDNTKAGFSKVGLYPLNLNWVKEHINQISLLKGKCREQKFDLMCHVANKEKTVSDTLNRVAYLDLALDNHISAPLTLPLPLHELKFKKSISILLTQAKEHHSPVNKKKVIGIRRNMIGEIHSQPKILNEPERLETLTKEKEKRAAKKRKDFQSKNKKSLSPRLEEEVPEKILKKTKVSELKKSSAFNPSHEDGVQQIMYKK
jgi:hypothetical protein